MSGAEPESSTSASSWVRFFEGMTHVQDAHTRREIRLNRGQKVYGAVPELKRNNV